MRLKKKLKQILRYYLKSLLPEKNFNNLKSIYTKIFPANEKKTDSKLLQYNENLFHDLGINLETSKLTLEKLGKNYSSNVLSWHYHLFAGISDIFIKHRVPVKKILEIGTHNGDFANFISKVFPESEIYTIDLPHDDDVFTNSYGRYDEIFKNEFLLYRSSNLKSENIHFIEMSSSCIVNEFKDIKFDIVWIDGDHVNPQVTMDIMNTLQLTHEQSLICVDDIIKEEFKEDYLSNESFQTLTNLEKNNILKNSFIAKRTYAKQKPLKYVAVSSKM